jgi:alpha-L-rhamnosidase
MKSNLKILLVVLSALAFLSGTKVSEPRCPYGLMTEFIREPAGTRIMDLTPEFTWIVPPAAGMQSAFQLLISTSRENINNNKGDTWDSGKTISSASANVEAGVTLMKNTRYFWKVRIWGSNGKPSQYSEIQSFLTGNESGYAVTRNRFVESLNMAEKVVKKADGTYFIDFGKDAFGTLVLDIVPQKEETITIHLGEKISGINEVDRNPGGSIRYQKATMKIIPRTSHYTLALPPDTRNTGAAAVHLPDSLGVVTPFRYCEIENCSALIDRQNAYQKALTYFFDDNSGSFTSSDTILNQVWDICKYSIKATSFAGLYVDGDRERIPYEADAYINQLGHYYTDREYSMGRATNEYFIDHPTWPTEWILHTVLLFYNDLMVTGNIESVAGFYDKLKQKTLASLARNDGLISSKNVSEEIMKRLGFSNTKERIRDIVDWPPAQKDTGWKLAGPDGERDGYEMTDLNTVVNAFYYRNLILMSEIARIIGKGSDSEFYKKEATRVFSSFNSVFLDPVKGIYTDGEGSSHSSLHANMMALAFGLVPVKNMETVIGFIKSRGMACSVYGSQYLLEGLYRAGEGEYALSLMTDVSDRSWWNMIRSGSTITMEAWDMKYKPNSDWNHAWGAAPANIIPGYLWGITPAEPGFETCRIEPQPGNLKYSKIKVPTIRGFITAEYRDMGKSKEFKISIPGNMKCDFIPSPGKIIKLKPGLNKIRVNNN